MPLMLNDVKLGGNLTRDPELHAVGQNTVANFGLAINRKYKGADGEMKEEVTFVDIECWGRQAELCQQYIVYAQKEIEVTLLMNACTHYRAIVVWPRFNCGFLCFYINLMTIYYAVVVCHALVLSIVHIHYYHLAQCSPCLRLALRD